MVQSCLYAAAGVAVLALLFLLARDVAFGRASPIDLTFAGGLYTIAFAVRVSR